MGYIVHSDDTDAYTAVTYGLRLVSSSGYDLCLRGAEREKKEKHSFVRNFLTTRTPHTRTSPCRLLTSFGLFVGVWVEIMDMSQKAQRAANCVIGLSNG